MFEIKSPSSHEVWGGWTPKADGWGAATLTDPTRRFAPPSPRIRAEMEESLYV